MYFAGELSIDVCQLKQIKWCHPTKLFKRLAIELTNGANQKIEHQTYCAVSILQQINMVMRATGVKDPVRLEVDDTVFWDKNGFNEDFGVIELHGVNSRLKRIEMMKSLVLFLEHEDATFKFLVSVRVHCMAEAGFFPIEIEVNGLIKQLRAKEREYPQFGDFFASQEDYEKGKQELEGKFKVFMETLQVFLELQLNVNEIKVRLTTGLLRPSAKFQISEVEKRKYIAPIFSDFPEKIEYTRYLFFWSELCHKLNIYLKCVSLMNLSGEEMVYIGEKGFFAGKGSAMNLGKHMKIPQEAETIIGRREKVTRQLDHGPNWLKAMFPYMDWKKIDGTLDVDGDGNCDGCEG